jgi:hypothetical protein
MGYLSSTLSHSSVHAQRKELVAGTHEPTRAHDEKPVITHITIKPPHIGVVETDAVG